MSTPLSAVIQSPGLALMPLPVALITLVFTTMSGWMPSEMVTSRGWPDSILSVVPSSVMPAAVSTALNI